MQLNLGSLLPLIEEVPAYKELVSNLKHVQRSNQRALILDSAKPFLIAALYQNLRLPVLVITAQPENAKRLYEQISLWCNTEELNIFPDPDTLAYQRTISDFSIEQERLQVLNTLGNADKNNSRPLIISSATALIQKSVSKNDFVSNCISIKTGTDIDPLRSDE